MPINNQSISGLQFVRLLVIPGALLMPGLPLPAHQFVLDVVIRNMCTTAKTCNLNVRHPALAAVSGDVLRVVSSCAW
jgi:hypothetical protein